MSGLVSPEGRPIGMVQKQGNPPPDGALQFLGICREMMLEAEGTAYRGTKGTVRKKLEAAKASSFICAKTLDKKEVDGMRATDGKGGVAWLGPHLFGTIDLTHPGQNGTTVARVRVRCVDLRKQFDSLREDGYTHLPNLGIAPAELLDAMRYDRRDRKEKT